MRPRRQMRMHQAETQAARAHEAARHTRRADHLKPIDKQHRLQAGRQVGYRSFLPVHNMLDRVAARRIVNVGRQMAPPSLLPARAADDHEEAHRTKTADLEIRVQATSGRQVPRLVARFSACLGEAAHHKEKSGRHPNVFLCVWAARRIRSSYHQVASCLPR